MKPKLLFVDDNWERIRKALDIYGERYEVVIALTVPDTLRQLVGNNFSVLSLDHDLLGHDFQDVDSPNCGSEIARYISKTGWPEHRLKPEIWLHTTNMFAGNAMKYAFEMMGFKVFIRPFGWKQYQHGVVAGAFDVIHPGYIYLLKEAKEWCHKVTVLLHDKPNQVFDLETRTTVLLGLKYVDDVIPYETEKGLDELYLKLKPDVRIVGSDHQGESTRPNLDIKTIYHKRDGIWSATRYKKIIAMKVNNADSL